MKPLYYILDATDVVIPTDDPMLFAEFMRDYEKRIIALDEKDGVRVSTVFLALDHNFFGGPPVLWETMIFGGEHDGYQDRYTSKKAALVGHKAACKLAFGRGSIKKPHTQMKTKT